MTLTRERLLEVLEYQESSGHFLRNFDSRGHKKGTVAGNITEKGYWRIKIDGKLYYGHRLVFLYFGEVLKEGDFIDHINGYARDNRRCNLRVVTSSQNSCNRGMRLDNTSGIKGVNFNVRQGKWSARIQLEGDRVFLGVLRYSVACRKCCGASKRENT